MERVSSKSGIEYMTMLSTTIWEIQTKVQNMPALFLVDHRSIRIREEEELAGNQQKQVENWIQRVFSYLFEWNKKYWIQTMASFNQYIRAVHFVSLTISKFQLSHWNRSQFWEKTATYKPRHLCSQRWTVWPLEVFRFSCLCPEIAGSDIAPRNHFFMWQNYKWIWLFRRCT